MSRALRLLFVGAAGLAALQLSGCGGAKTPVIRPAVAETKPGAQPAGRKQTIAARPSAGVPSPSGQDAAADYARTLEEAKKSAEVSLAARDYAAAGAAYAALAGDYETAVRRGRGPNFSRAEIESGLRSCRVELTRRGLEQYREGRLDEAVATWLSLLRFDPANAEIRKAIETARAQQKELQRK